MPSDNSVLVSLKELRRIEEKRVDQEEEGKRRAELERRKRIDEEQRMARELAERRKAEAEEQRRQEQQQREREAREERLRLAEAERRARVEAEMALERERLAMSMGHVATKGSGGALRRFAIVTAAVAAGAAIAYLGSALRTEKARSQVLVSKLAGLSERSREAASDARQQIDLLGHRVGQLKARLATTSAPPASGARSDPGPRAKPRPAGSKAHKAKPKIGEECKDSTDPICGLTGKKKH